MTDKPDPLSDEWFVEHQVRAWDSIPWRCQACDWAGDARPSDYIGAAMKIVAAAALEWAAGSIGFNAGDAQVAISAKAKEIRRE